MEKPCPGVRPIVFGGARREPERLGGFLVGHADEVTKLHDFRLERVQGGKSIKSFVDGEQLIIVAWQGEVHVFNIHALLAAAVSEGALLAGAVNEDPSHGLGGCGEEVSSIFKPWVL